MNNLSEKTRGPGIPSEWKRYIAFIALDDSHKPRMLLADQILEEMQNSGDFKEFPERESIAKRISIARNSLTTDEDEPWSIAASVKYGYPAEVTKDLYYIWRVSSAIGRPISIRHAKWIIHIRNLYHSSSTGDLYSDKITRCLTLIRQSWLYSLFERTSKIMEEKTLNSNSLDAEIFMPYWEHSTALNLNAVLSLNFPQGALSKLEKHGASLISPPHSINSVEEAVWFSIRTKPLNDLEYLEDPKYEVLPEYDLVAAYWLRYLSEGPLWHDLPETQEEIEELENRKNEREAGHWVPDSEGWGGLYYRQKKIRGKVREWVETDAIRRQLLLPVRTGSVIEQYRLDNKIDDSPPFNATLLKTVGYEVGDEELEVWFNLHEQELRYLHTGFDRLPRDVQERFIHDKHTFADIQTLNIFDEHIKNDPTKGGSK